MSKQRKSTDATKAGGLAAISGQTLARDVERLFQQAGPSGLTDEEARAALAEKGIDKKEGTIRARRNELTNAGRLVNSNRTRPTAAGVSATVWVHAQFAGQIRTVSPETIHVAPRPCRHCGGQQWREQPEGNRPGWILTTCAGCHAIVGYREDGRREDSELENF